jgi:phage-related minor tail protein
MNAHDLFKDTALQGLERFREALSDNDKQAAELAQRIDQLADQSMTAFTDSFYDAIVGAKSFEAAFKDMARSIIEDLSKMLIQYYITQSIFGAIVNAFSPKPLVGPTGIEFGPAANHVTRAMGGPVAGGKPYLVGERGPELMVPAGNGTIIPNDSLVGGSVTVVQNINVTTGVQQTVRAEIANLLPQISNAAKAAVADGRMRGGGFGKAMGG